MLRTELLEMKIKKLNQEIAVLKQESGGVFDKKKPILIVRLGDKSRGWMPSSRQLDEFSDNLLSLGIGLKYNILTVPYIAEFEILKDKRLKKLKSSTKLKKNDVVKIVDVVNNIK